MALELRDVPRDNEDLMATLQPIIWAVRGEPSRGISFRLHQVNDSADYAVDARNFGDGRLALRARASGHELTVNGTGISVTSMTSSGGIQVNGNLTVTGTAAVATLTATTGTFAVVNTQTMTASGPVQINAGLTVTGTAAAATLTANSATIATLTASSATINSATINSATINSATIATLTATAFSADDLIVVGDLTAGSTNAAAHTFVGVTTFRNAASTATQMMVDAGNNRVVLLSGTPLGSDTTPAVHVVGRLYLAPESANDLAYQVRRSSSATTGWGVGVNAAGDHVFKEGSSERFRIGSASSTYQMVATGDADVTGYLIVGTTVRSGSEMLRVNGTTRMDNALNVVTGGITITAGGLSCTGSATFSTNVVLSAGVLSAPGISVTANGASITGGLVLNPGGGYLWQSSNTVTVGSGPRTLVKHVLVSDSGTNFYVALYQA